MAQTLKARALRRASRRSTAAALIAAFGAGCVVAAAAPATAADRGAASTLLIETGSVYAPRGYAQLCRRRPEICATERTAADVARMRGAMKRLFGRKAVKVDAPELTRARMRMLHQVNTTVNATIRPVEDRGPDRWTLTSAAGDCEEYVLMKRELLASLGWPRTALRIAVVRDGAGYHAVLVVSTRQGEFVLDNMVGHITRMKDSPYEFVVAQSAFNPGAWVRVRRKKR